MLILVRGLPGSGKTTFAKKCRVYLHLEADMFFVDANKKYVFDGSRIKQAHEWCQNTARIMLNNNIPVIVSNTFTTIKEMQFYLDCEIPFTIYRMTREYGSIHDVPSETIERMRSRFEPIKGETLI